MGGYYGGSGVAVAASTGTTTSSYNPATDTLSGTAKNPDGSNGAGLTVRIFVDTALTATYTVTTGSDGTWSKSPMNFGDGNPHTYIVYVDYISSISVTGGYSTAFKRVRFDGTTFGRLTTGLNPNADIATITSYTVSGGAIQQGSMTFGASGATGAGANYEPGVLQNIIKITGTGSGFTGTVAARSDGKLYDTDIAVTNGGTSITTGATFAITRKVSKFIIAGLFMPATTIATNDTIYGDSASFGISAVGTTSIRLVHTSTAVGVFSGFNNTTPKRFILAVDYTLPAASGGYTAYVDDVAQAAPTTFAVGSFKETGNYSSHSPNVGIMANSAGTGIADGDLSYLYAAFGMDAIDTVTGKLPDFTQQTVRDRFTSTNIGPNGAGVTGRQPLVFLTGDASTFLTNKGRGNAFTQTGTLTNV